MHFRDFNAIAAELREGDTLRVELVSGGQLSGELTGQVKLGSPEQNGEISLLVAGDIRRLTAKELSELDLIQ